MITAAAYRPFEAERRAFVIEAADAMADESQNALLKTLEEPAPYVHLMLITSEPAALLETVRSRCQPVRFAPLADECGRGAAGRAGAGRRRARAPGRGSPGGGRLAAGGVSARRRRSRAPCRGRARASPRRDREAWPTLRGRGVLAAAEAAGAQAGEAAQARPRRPGRRDRGNGPAAGRSDREAGEADQASRPAGPHRGARPRPRPDRGLVARPGRDRRGRRSARPEPRSGRRAADDRRPASTGGGAGAGRSSRWRLAGTSRSTWARSSPWRRSYFAWKRC